MMKVVVLAAVAGSAAAFAPSPATQTRTALGVTDAQVDFFGIEPTAARVDLSGEIGALPPLGFFDPLGLVADGDKEEFDRLRWVELKHGRISMLATVGYLVTYAGVRFPGAEDIPAGFAALDATPGMVWAQFSATVAMMEMANQDIYMGPWGTNQNTLGDSPAEFKGDFRNGFIDFGWDRFDDATKLRKRTIELNNGRAAMCGILGLMVHEKLGNIDAILP